MTHYISLAGITKTYIDRHGCEAHALRNISINIDEGKLVTFLGPSGCGKTTALRIVAGFENPTSGSVFIGGRDMTLTPPNKRQAAMVFQQYALFPHMDIFHNVAFGLTMQRLPRSEIKEKVRVILTKVGLHDLATRFPSQLSGGQQQRVALARALVTQPKVLLCDEPLSNLDASMRMQMRREIRTIQREFGITTIYVTHDQEEAMAISDTVVLLKDGVIEQIGSPKELYLHPATPFVSSFLGQANVIDANIAGSSSGGWKATIMGNELLLSDHLSENARKATLIIRPEAITVIQDR